MEGQNRFANDVYVGTVFRKQRQSRKITIEQASEGLVSHTKLRELEIGEAPWKKTEGDTLLYRLGICPDYFEIVTDAKELERWKCREKICEHILEEPATAERWLEEYDQQFRRQSNVEKQFVKKMKGILLAQRLRKGEGDRKKLEKAYLTMALESANCTMKLEEGSRISSLFLSPGELESVLLTADAYGQQGQVEKGIELFYQVWDYIKAQAWEARIQVRILPQAAWVGMALLEKRQLEKAVEIGWEALELLRHQNNSRYALQLCDALAVLLSKFNGCDEKMRTAVERFQKLFQQLNREFQGRVYRVWQCTSLENTYEMGAVIRVVREALGQSRTRLVEKGQEVIMEPRQLAKVEKGQHRPSMENYQELMNRLQRQNSFSSSLLETDSLEILSLRQEISSCMENRAWQQAEELFAQLENLVDMNQPRFRQALLLQKAVLLYKREGKNALEKSLAMLEDAKLCTIPAEVKHLEHWIYQNQEGLVMANIAYLHYEKGDLEKAREIYLSLWTAYERQLQQMGAPYEGYAVILAGMVTVLGQLGEYKYAMKMDEKAICLEINTGSVNYLPIFLYDWIQNRHELLNSTQKDLASQETLSAYFSMVLDLAEFGYSKDFLTHLKAEKKKYIL